MYFKLLLLLVLLTPFSIIHGQKKSKRPLVIAYYTGDSALINKFDVGLLDEIIYSFAHVRNDSITIGRAKDSISIRNLVSLKQRYPKLKVLLSMGGWSGCAPCSETFSRENGRNTFANTTKHILKYFGLDGLDLDWEYPTIEGFPGHLYQPSDKTNFTELIKTLRKTLGKKYEISFAAGGFQKYLEESVEWKKIMPLLTRVNIMSYDLVSGYATVTGHHTPLYSTNSKEESTDRAVEYLLKLGVPNKKIAIGGAFYTRIWKRVAPINYGLYQPGEHTRGVDFLKYDSAFTAVNGWQYYWDEKAHAPYWYNTKDSAFATGDDIRSIKEKTQYAIDKQLGGIMFWELPLDKPNAGLTQAIVDVIAEKYKKK